MTLSRRTVSLSLASLVLASASTWASAQSAANPRVKFATSQGEFVVELEPAKAPKTVENILQYVNDKHYEGTVFHRVIDGFMIQGGGFTADMQQKPTRAPIPLANNDMLNAPNPDGHGYAVFGKVVQGQAVIDKIRTVPTGNRGMHQNVPVSAVTITSATVLK